MKKISLFLLLVGFAANAQAVKEVSSTWMSFMQGISIESKTKKKFKVEASVKVITNDAHASGGLWARVDNKNDEKGFFENMEDRPITAADWQTYTLEGTIDSNSDVLNFGGVCEYNGKFYFDNFKLFIENDKGIFEQVPIQNNSFEQPAKDGYIPKWHLGVTKDKVIKVKEYDITASADKTDGKSAIMVEGKGIVYKERGKIGGVDGASPKIADMISMLEDLKDRVENKVKNMSQYELDYLHDENANRIGSLIMHLAAAEAYYQVYTFEGREFNDEEKKKWEVALELDQAGRDTFKGHEVQYYLDIYNEVRAKTIAELKKRDDAWFEEVQKGSGMSNHYCWFHVMEHQSSHLGQILFLAKRIPPEPVALKQPIKN
ncbi:DinB family protein [Flavobacterium sp. 3HN19-14]|uniref:DinB family protein n=1 Tax=Flavobacterium sp. 3HN19-14 TaxID=3448133 RepID=UPI003EE23FA8